MPEGPAGAAEREDPIEKMANTIPPIPGVEPRQLLKAGWTVIGGNPAAKVAHFPKTYRTPAPKFPRHRIRTTWGFKDEAWSLLEDSVNIDEIEGVYGEVPEGTIASITLFALPEGEEEAQADSDVEPYSVPKAKKDEASLRAEAASTEHQLTHRPKNPFCPICQRAKKCTLHRRGRQVDRLRSTVRHSPTTSRLTTSSLPMLRTTGFRMRLLPMW